MLNTWNPLIPRQSAWFYDIFYHLRLLKALFRGRFELDHYMDSVEDTTDPTADGYHKYVNMAPLVPNTLLPGDLYPFDRTTETVKVPNGAGIVYTEMVDGKLRLRYTTEVRGKIVRSTLR